MRFDGRTPFTRGGAFAFALILLSTLSALDLAAQSIAGKRNVLVVYFSWAENTREYAERGIDAVSSASTNSRMIATRIHERLGGDIVGIQTVTPYTADYNEVLDVALKEQNQGARPPLKTRIPGIAKYDLILLGYPNWWASIPMSVATFLESYDLTGKTIVPFCTHGGGRLGQTVAAIAKSAPNAKVLKGLSISYGGGGSLDRDIDRWLKSIGITVQ